jgi:hypothetical protein
MEPMASIRDLLVRLAAAGFRSGGPASPDAVARLETEFDLSLPPDYREYLLAAGGGPSTAPDAVTGLWPLASIAVFNRTYRIPWIFPGLVGIGNDGFLVYAYDFRNSPPVIASLGLSSSLWDDVVTDADTFTEWLERRIR